MAKPECYVMLKRERFLRHTICFTVFDFAVLQISSEWFCNDLVASSFAQLLQARNTYCTESFQRSTHSQKRADITQLPVQTGFLALEGKRYYSKK